MSDQASKLRALRLVHGRTDENAGRDDRPRASRPSTLTVAVTSGKGGVGKSAMMTNLAIACARQELRVLLVDGDLSLANVDLLMGLVPKKNLADVVMNGVPIEEVVIDTPSGVRLLPAASGIEELADLDDFRREGFIRELSRLEESCDVILIDTATGISRQSMHLVGAADRILVVTTPEPTAFSDAYATIKVLSRKKSCGDISLVVNRASSSLQGRDTARRIQAVSKRFLGFQPEYLGHVPEDSAFSTSVMRQEPLLSIFPHSPAATSIESLADNVLQGPEPNSPLTADPEGYFGKVANLDR